MFKNTKSGLEEPFGSAKGVGGASEQEGERERERERDGDGCRICIIRRPRGCNTNKAATVRSLLYGERGRGVRYTYIALS